MDIQKLKALLDAVAKGTRRVDEAMAELRDMPFSDLDVAKLDGHRALRNGFSEVILCEGKRCDHVIRIVEEVAGRGGNVFGTRASAEVGQALREKFQGVDWDPTSRTFRLARRPPEPLEGRLAVACAGTADIPVAEEARRTAEFFGVEAARFYDVGIAGLHRVIGCLDSLRATDVVIVVAGMEGALPSVIGGLIAVPIVAVPTSVGYGVSFNGVSALLGMLNSCSEGIAVVNIDNGFGAACAALRILRQIKQR